MPLVIAPLYEIDVDYTLQLWVKMVVGNWIFAPFKDICKYMVIDMFSPTGSIITKIDAVLTKMEIIAGPAETQGAGNATWVEGGLYLKCYQ